MMDPTLSRPRESSTSPHCFPTALRTLKGLSIRPKGSRLQGNYIPCRNIDSEDSALGRVCDWAGVVVVDDGSKRIQSAGGKPQQAM